MIIIPNPNDYKDKKSFMAACPNIVLKEGTAKDINQAIPICHSMWDEHLKKSKHEAAETFVPPESGDAPSEVKQILKSAYSNCRSRHRTDFPGDTEDENRTRCSKIAWGAVKNAGWHKDSEGKWVKTKQSEHSTEYELFTFECELKSFSCNKEKIDMEKSEIKEDENWITFDAVASIGDRITKDVYVPYSELKKSLNDWNGTFHDINHMATSYPHTEYPFSRQNIEYIIGYQDNVRSDDTTKKLIMSVHINKHAPKFEAWKSFIDTCKASNKVPNVSISAYIKRKMVKAKELNLSSDEYDADDYVPYIYDIIPRALTTTMEGACNDKDGCGICINNECKCRSCKSNECSTNNTDEHDNNENEEQNKKIEYLKIRIEKLKGGN